MTHYDSTARVPFAKGGKVDKKPIKPKRIILWKGKAKDWPGAKKAKERTGKAKGGAFGPLRGTSGSRGVAKAFRGKEGFKESQKLQKKLQSQETAGWRAHLKRRSRVFKENQKRLKALDIKEGKK